MKRNPAITSSDQYNELNQALRTNTKEGYANQTIQLLLKSMKAIQMEAIEPRLTKVMTDIKLNQAIKQTNKQTSCRGFI